MRRRASRPRAGFTLIELLVVIVIIGILLAFILGAAFAGVEYTKVQATRELIAKLDVAISDRLDSLLSITPTVTGPATVAGTHLHLSSLDPTTGALPSQQRAAVIAQIDLIRAEMPDVFYLDSSSTATLPPGGSDLVISYYPLNFGAISDAATISSPFLPIGAVSSGNVITGVNGASFTAIGGIVKNLGFQPQGYDGLDNNADGYPDDLSEAYSGTTAANALLTVKSKLATHTHKTARAEMLYAILVEGLGPLGSAFNAEDFTSREVMDTDNDGLPELVDAWGEPLQFYRWPIYHDSDFQKGYFPYGSISEERDQNPLDPNQQLVAPAWFIGAGGTAPDPGSAAVFFQSLFFSLVDPLAYNSPTTGQLWDRGSAYSRRAYSVRPLILSGGPDQLLGVGQLAFDYSDYGGSTALGLSAANLISSENQAAKADPNRSGTYLEQVNTTSATTQLIQSWGLDDISNQNLPTPGGSR